jgi:hypothetical protein
MNAGRVYVTFSDRGDVEAAFEHGKPVLHTMPGHPDVTVRLRTSKLTLRNLPVHEESAKQIIDTEQTEPA